MDIQLNNNGSGRLSIEYRISHALNNLGALDGNVSFPVIPAGKEDIERTIQRIPGMKLLSYSSRQTERDMIINVNMEFDSPQALLAFIDPQGNKASIINNGQSGIFELIIINNEFDITRYDENLIPLMRTFFNDYDFTINFTASGNSSITITDGERNIISSPSSLTTTRQGRRVSLSMNIVDILTYEGGFGIKINW